MVGGRVFSVREPVQLCGCGAPHERLQFAQGRTLASFADEAHAIDAVRLWVKQYVAAFAPRRTFVHAGVVAFDRQAVLVPGQSHSGKTTLVAALLRAGGVYYSDEYAVLDSEGHVSPYLQPLGMREPGSHAQVDLAPTMLGATLGVDAIDVALVVSTAFSPGARWEPRTVTRSETVMALLEHAVAARRAPQRTMQVLTRATRQARGLSGPRGDADETARLIIACLTGQ